MMHKKSLIIIIIIGIIAITITFLSHHYYSNMNSKLKFMKVGPMRVLLTERNMDVSSLFEDDDLLDYDLNYDPNDLNYCLQNYSFGFNAQQQLMSFIKGPCSPVVIVPGITATRLQITIDCEELRDEAPEIFASCGWGTCSWSIFHSRPSDEYTLWIASLDSPMGFLLPEWSTQECFGNLVNLVYNSSETEIYLKYSSPPGVNVTWYGNTPLTISDSECGFQSIKNLLPLPFQNSETAGYAQVQKYLKYMGYQSGLSMFAIPYDFRKTTLANDISYTLERTIKYIHALTGKKVIIMAHSMGNFGVLNILNGMSQKDKEKMVLNYIAMTPPFLGAPKALKIIIGGDNEYVWHSIGLSFYSQKMFIGSSSAGYDLLPKDGFFLFQNQTWLNEIYKRVNLENTYDAETLEGQEFWEKAEKAGNFSFNWFPTPLRKCFEGFVYRNNSCIMPIDDWANTPLLTLNYDNFSKEYYADYNNLTNVLEDFVTFSDHSLNLLKDAYENNIQELKNPGVPVVLIYGSHSPTEYIVDYDYNPNPITLSGNFAWPTSETMTQGDSTVSTTSTMLPGLKWAWEYDNKNSSKEFINSKPVKLMEWCSFYNSRETIYDTNNTDKIKEITKNEYIGLNCSCQPSTGKYTTGDNCVHATIMNDVYFINLLRNIVKTNNAINDINATYANNLTADDLNSLVSTCPILTSDRSIQDIDDLFNMKIIN